MTSQEDLWLIRKTGEMVVIKLPLRSTLTSDTIREDERVLGPMAADGRLRMLAANEPVFDTVVAFSKAITKPDEIEAALETLLRKCALEADRVTAPALVTYVKHMRAQMDRELRRPTVRRGYVPQKRPSDAHLDVDRDDIARMRAETDSLLGHATVPEGADIVQNCVMKTRRRHNQPMSAANVRVKNHLLQVAVDRLEHALAQYSRIKGLRKNVLRDNDDLMGRIAVDEVATCMFATRELIGTSSLPQRDLAARGSMAYSTLVMHSRGMLDETIRALSHLRVR